MLQQATGNCPVTMSTGLVLARYASPVSILGSCMDAARLVLASVE